jgi:hypothetical protein
MKGVAQVKRSDEKIQQFQCSIQYQGSSMTYKL